jgi:hypothetical protein
MSTVGHRRAAGPREVRLLDGVNLVSLAVLFVCLVAIAVMLVGIAVRGTTPLVLLAPVALGFVAILDLRRR